jgi:hypothetical protein
LTGKNKNPFVNNVYSTSGATVQKIRFAFWSWNRTRCSKYYSRWEENLFYKMD